MCLNTICQVKSQLHMGGSAKLASAIISFDGNEQLSKCMIDLSTQVRHQDLSLSFNRFWSSPPELPLRNVIGVVLTMPDLRGCLYSL